jgi:short-subunit dehydrogenase
MQRAGMETSEEISRESIMNRDTKRLLAAGAVGLGAVLAGRAALRSFCSYTFRDKIVLITGGSRGLGLVLARELAAEGARLAICARDEGELRRAESDLVARGARVLALPCDVTDRQQIEQMVERIQRDWGPVDVLINNAGTIQVGPMEEMTLTDYDEAMKIHLWAPLYATLAVLPGMKHRNGRVVNIASIGGKISVPHLLPYSASKFALVGLSEGLRAELAEEGVFVTTVCPGLMRTGSPRNAYFKGRHRQEYTWFNLSDAMPGISMSAERAARKILDAARHGDAEVVLSVPAKLAATLHGVAPGLTSRLMGLVNRVLPRPGGIGRNRATGAASNSFLTRSWLTLLDQKAANRNNQIPPA